MAAAVALAFKVSGMHCASCGLLIDEALEDLPGVARSTTDPRAGRAVVQVDLNTTSVDEILAAISATGYEATPERTADAR